MRPKSGSLFDKRRQPTNEELRLAVENALADAWLDYVNNYLTVDAWADAYGFTVKGRIEILKYCHDAHETRVERLNA